MTYAPFMGGLRADTPLETGDSFVIVADHIRHSTTGVHARVALFLNTQLLVHSTFNVDRDEELTRLSNSAFKMLGTTIQKIFPVARMKHELSLFCWGLWPAFVGGQVAQPAGSDSDERGCTFALEPFVVDDGGTIIFAPPIAGKSWIALAMAISIDAGVSLFWPICQRKVLYVNLERSQRSVERRIRQINRCLDIEPSRRLLCLHRRGAKLSDMLPAIERSVEDQGVQVLFLDSISRAGYGDLTQNEPANAIMDALNAACPTWVAIAHTPRADPTHVYGGIHFDAAADLLVQVLTQRTEEGLGVGLQLTGANDLPPYPLYILALEFGDSGLSSIYKARPHQFPEIEAGKKMSLEEEVIEFLEEVGKASATDIARQLGRNRQNISTLLKHSNRFVPLGVKGKTSSVVYGVRTYEDD